MNGHVELPFRSRYCFPVIAQPDETRRRGGSNALSRLRARRPCDTASRTTVERAQNRSAKQHPTKSSSCRYVPPPSWCCRSPTGAFEGSNSPERLQTFGAPVAVARQSRSSFGGFRRRNCYRPCAPPSAGCMDLTNLLPTSSGAAGRRSFGRSSTKFVLSQSF